MLVKYSFTLSDKTDEFIELVVTQIGPILHHAKAIVRCYTTKSVRDEVGKKLVKEKEVTSTYYSIRAHKLQSKNFNFTNIPYLRALNQIKHLQTKEEKLHSDPLIEIVKHS